MIYIHPGSQIRHVAEEIEGAYYPGQTVILVDDLMTRGGSLSETADLLRSAGLMVHDAFVLIDRGAGGVERLRREGVNVHTLLTLEGLLNYLLSRELITQAAYAKCLYLARRRSRNRSMSATANFHSGTIWTGDCLDIMRGMNSETVDLIYLDPPFNSNAQLRSNRLARRLQAQRSKTPGRSPMSDAEWINLIEQKQPAVHRALLAAMTGLGQELLGLPWRRACWRCPDCSNRRDRSISTAIRR